MQGFSKKLTAYDFLGILIPGIVVVYCICPLFCPSAINEISVCFSCGCKIEVKSSQTLFDQACILIIFGAVSYIVGIIINCLSDCIFGRFRNNRFHLCFTALLYKERQFGLHSNRKHSSFKSFIRIIWRSRSHIVGFRKVNYTSTEKRYYNLYYWLLNNNRLSGAVGVIESQVVFVRNMFLPTIALAIYFFIACKFVAGALFILLCFIEVIVMLLRQLRVYYIVIEDYHWYKQMFDDDKKNNISNH